MANPYRENMDRIQALVKELTREHMYTTRPEERYGDDPNYGYNFVVASGGEAFDVELEQRVQDLMTTLTGKPDPESVGPPPTQEPPASPEEDTDDANEDPITEEEQDEPNPENL